MNLTTTLQCFLCDEHRISHWQFSIWPHTSVLDVLRVVRDWFLSHWAQGL